MKPTKTTTSSPEPRTPELLSDQRAQLIEATTARQSPYLP